MEGFHGTTWAVSLWPVSLSLSLSVGPNKAGLYHVSLCTRRLKKEKKNQNEFRERERDKKRVLCIHILSNFRKSERIKEKKDKN